MSKIVIDSSLEQKLLALADDYNVYPEKIVQALYDFAQEDYSFGEFIEEYGEDYCIEDLNEEVDEIPNFKLYYPNGEKVKSEIDLVAAIMRMYGIDGKKARENIKNNVYSLQKMQDAIDWWVKKEDEDAGDLDESALIKHTVKDILEGADVRKALSGK